MMDEMKITLGQETERERRKEKVGERV